MEKQLDTTRTRDLMEYAFNYGVPDKLEICSSVIQLKVMMAAFPNAVMRNRRGYLYRYNGLKFQKRYGSAWRETSHYEEPPYWPHKMEED